MNSNLDSFSTWAIAFTAVCVLGFAPGCGGPDVPIGEQDQTAKGQGGSGGSMGGSGGSTQAGGSGGSGVCIDQGACIQNTHWDSQQCRCIPDPTDAGLHDGRDGGVCVNSGACIQNTHWDSQQCRCIPDSTACDASPAPPTGRPEAVACPMTDITSFGYDGGAIACVADADCQDAGGIRTFCRSGSCRADGCLSDTDCGAGQACVCADMLRGNIFHTNRCMDTSCRVDADCGAGGLCSPSYSSHCSSLGGYYCHTAADTCRTNADCCGDAPTCLYQAPLGHWACQAVIVCNG
jgi:hypothetical protein